MKLLFFLSFSFYIYSFFFFMLLFCIFRSLYLAFAHDFSYHPISPFSTYTTYIDSGFHTVEIGSPLFDLYIILASHYIKGSDFHNIFNRFREGQNIIKILNNAWLKNSKFPPTRHLG